MIRSRPVHRALRPLVSGMLLLLLLLPGPAVARPGGGRGRAALRTEVVRAELETTDRLLDEARRAAVGREDRTVRDLLTGALRQQEEARDQLEVGHLSRARTATRVAGRLAGRVLEILMPAASRRESFRTGLARAEARLEAARRWGATRSDAPRLGKRFEEISRTLAAARTAYDARRAQAALKYLAGVRQLFGELEALGLPPDTAEEAERSTTVPGTDDPRETFIQRAIDFVGEVERRVPADRRQELSAARRSLESGSAPRGHDTQWRNAVRAVAAATRAAEALPVAQVVTTSPALLLALRGWLGATPSGSETQLNRETREAVRRQVGAGEAAWVGGEVETAWAQAVAAVRQIFALEGVAP